MKSTLVLLTAAALAISGAVTSANAEPCTAADFADAVDKSGAALRAFTLEAQPKLQERMRRYSDLKKLPAAGYEDAALDAIQDSKLTAFDEKSAAMLLRIDSLGRVAEGASPDCGKLEDVKALSRELLSVMKAKSDYMLAPSTQKLPVPAVAILLQRTSLPRPPNRHSQHLQKATPEKAAPAEPWPDNNQIQ